LKQKLGFKDVRRLEKGIIGYEKWIEEHPEKQASSVWKGKNFLFDKRRFEEQEDDDDTLSMKSSASSS
jgi:predicted sulfurtransferase